MDITKHHLIPKQKFNKKKWKRSYKGLNIFHQERTINVCIPCSKQIHALFSNSELKQNYNTLEKLKAAPEIQKWIKWARSKEPIDLRYHGKGRFHL